MCEKKLTAREKFVHWERANAMRAEGVDIEIPEEWRDAAPLIIEPSEYNSQVFDSQAGGSAAYALEVRLIARRSITVLNCRIATYWDDDIQLANPPLRDESFHFAGKEFPKREVLNSRLEKPLVLRPGQVVEGTILACGLRRIPDDHKQSSRSSCTLALEDQYRSEVSAEVPILMDRTWKRALSTPRPDGKSLYGGPPQPARIDVNAASRASYLEALRRERQRLARQMASRKTDGQEDLTMDSLSERIYFSTKK